MKKIILLIALLTSYQANAWDGVDSNTGTSVEIESGNLVRAGNDIEVYRDGEYRDVEVQDINSYGGSTEVEVYDYTTGEYSTYEMD